MIRVLFACVQNAGRSQIAAAWFNALADPGLAHAVSAGTRPGVAVHPEVVAVMREVGIDLEPARPTLLTPALAGTADVVVTMGCGEDCPVVPGAKREDWAVPDPHGRPLDEVRLLRDTLRDRVTQLLRANGWLGRQRGS